eukprot:7381899-Prymnesium_polylepis.1
MPLSTSRPTSPALTSSGQTALSHLSSPVPRPPSPASSLASAGPSVSQAGFANSHAPSNFSAAHQPPSSA